MRTVIFLIDTTNGKMERVETFRGTEKELTERLRELESGYCEDKMLEIVAHENYLFAISDSDYAYMARYRR